MTFLELPRWSSGKETTCQCRCERCELIPESEDPMGKGTATHSSKSRLRIPRTGSLDGYSSQGGKGDTGERTQHVHMAFLLSPLLSLPEREITGSVYESDESPGKGRLSSHTVTRGRSPDSIYFSLGESPSKLISSSLGQFPLQSCI